MNNFIKIEDITSLYRVLSDAESARAEKLIPVVADLLRQEAKNADKDLDCMLAEGKLMPNVLKSVMVDIIARVLMTPDSAPMTQTSQTALGYTYQGTFLNPGGGIFIKKAELHRLGIKRQRIGMVDFYGKPDTRCDC